MKILWNPFLVIWCFHTSLTSAQQTPYFRILAPQFLCSGSESSDFIPPSAITVAFQTRGGERLTYRVQVFFKLLDGFKNQRHTLSVWRSIRVLEKKIRDSKSEISIKNQIDILNEELIEGVEYTFNIIGVDAEANESPAQNFTITYRGSGSSIGFDQQSGKSSGEISFLLVGTWSIYWNMPFLMQGVIIFCEPNPHYKFLWKMTGFDEESTKYLKSSSKSLFIPGGVLLPGISHQVSVEVVNGEEIIAQASGTLNVIARDFEIQIVPNNQSIGLNREIIYTVYFDQFDSEHDTLNITWTCRPVEGITEDDSCLSKTSQDSRSVHLIFPEPGLHIVSVSVSINERTKNDSAFIEVQPDIITSVEFMTFDPFSVITGNSFSTVVQINYLTPQCLAEWVMVVQPQMNLEKGFGEMVINDLEENFLSELIEYENNTISYKLLLTVHGDSENSTGIKNGKNHFRLVIECPPLINEEEANNITSQNKDFIKAYVDLVLNSNDPPTVEELDVSPKNGTALKTLFKFSTGPALDSPADYPMRYKFYYFIEDFWILVGDFYENTVTSAELPFHESAIETKYVVCDSRDACRTVKGPSVRTTLYEGMSEKELSIKLNVLKGSLERQDYEEFFERAVSCIWTIYAMENMNFKDDTQKVVKDLMIGHLGEDKRVDFSNETLKEWKFIAEKLGDQELISKLDSA